MKRHPGKQFFRVLIASWAVAAVGILSVGCAHTKDGGPEVLDKKYPGGGAKDAGGAKAPDKSADSSKDR